MGGLGGGCGGCGGSNGGTDTSSLVWPETLRQATLQADEEPSATMDALTDEAASVEGAAVTVSLSTSTVLALLVIAGVLVWWFTS